MMKIVISASRRTDLVHYFPDDFIGGLEKYPPDRVHSIVIWTKDPGNMLKKGSLRNRLLQYDQLFIHYTITGLGGSILEPCIPRPAEAMGMLPHLIETTGSPDRIRVRFDPIVNLKKDGQETGNLGFFPELAAYCESTGIFNISTSWMSLYRKVARRLERSGIETAEFDFESQKAFIERTAADHGITLHYCCVPGTPASRCIDGEMLSRLHPRGERASLARAKGQRELCGCTHSVDIGWYSLKCRGGCLYCYAVP